MKRPTKPLTTRMLLAAVSDLEDSHLQQRTLAFWMEYGLVEPSIRGAGRASAIWSFDDDLPRVRLIVHLRKRGVSMQRVRAIFAKLGAELDEILKPGSGRALVVARAGEMVVDVSSGEERELPSGQLRLKLDAMFRGNEAAARRARAA